MNKDYFKDINQNSNDLLLEKQKILASPSNPEHTQTNNSKKGGHSSYYNPILTHGRPFLAHSKNYEPIQQSSSFKSQQINILTAEETRQRIKSSSFTQQSDSKQSKLDYLAFAQKQFKKDQQKKELQQKDKPIQVKIQSTEEMNQLKQKVKQLKETEVKLCFQSNKKDEIMIQKQKQLIYLRNKYDQLNNACDNINKRYEQAIIQLSRFKGIEEQFGKLLSQYHLINQKYAKYQQNQDYYARLQYEYSNVKQKCCQLECILQQKDQIIEKDRGAEHNQINSAVTSKNNIIRELEERINIYEKINHQLNNQINMLEMPKDIHPNINDGDTGNHKVQTMCKDFQNRINSLIQENLKLKNIIGHHQGKIQQLIYQNQSLQSTVQAFEERDSMNKTSVLQTEIYNLREKLQAQKEDKDKSISIYELQILKLQNQIQNQRFLTLGSLLDFSDQQKLHEKLMNSIDQIERLRSKLNQINYPKK